MKENYGKLVSVIIPVYNGAAFIEETIESVRGQVYKTFECIIVDDGSTDDTATIVAARIATDPRFSYVYQDNGGLSAARNTGLDHAKGDFIQFLDADDLLLPNKLETQMASLPEGDLVVSYTDYHTGLSSDIHVPSDFYCSPRFNTANPLLELVTRWESSLIIPPHCFLFSATFFREQKIRFERSLPNHEDFDCWVNIFRLQPDLVFIEEKLCIYRITDGSMSKKMRLMGEGFLQALEGQMKTNGYAGLKEVLLKKRRETLKRYNRFDRMTLSDKVALAPHIVNYYSRRIPEKLFTRNNDQQPAANPKEPGPNKNALSHLPELDSLRTIAVIMTLLAHFAPREIPYMWYGVPIFFTISGFLITTILLKSLYKDPGANRLPIIKNFMVRRALRLFPAYYLFITFFWLAKKFLSLYLWKDEFTPYFFTYTPNWLIYKIGSGATGCFSHLWSLGVEEQFYLFWPWVLLFPPKKFRLPIIITMIVFSLAFILIDYKDERIGAFPFANFHTLGVGALLAVFYTQQGKLITWLKDHRHLLFTLTFIHLIIVLVLYREAIPLFHLYREISLCVCTFSIVLVSIFGWRGLMGFIMRNKTIQYLGTISYGIYLYHMPVPFVYRNIISKVAPNFHLSPWPFMFLCFAITIGIAAFSYRFIETPFLKLKSRFS